MAKGSVVVLHRKDSANDLHKVETNNIGFQSTVDTYQTEAAQLIYDFGKYRQANGNLIVNLEEVNSILQTYIYVANRMYDILYRIAIENAKVDKFIELEKEARKWTL